MLRVIRLLALALALGTTTSGCAKHGPTSAHAAPAGARNTEPPRLATRGEASPNPAPDVIAPSATPHDAAESDFDRGVRDDRPGLGTEFGEERFSAVVDAPFHRASNIPDAELSLFYNDVEGVRAAAGRFAPTSHAGLESRITSADGLVTMSLVDDSGRSFPAAQIDHRRYAIGRGGDAYRIGVENHGRARLEVVVTVDGLDVLDGDDGGFHKRGYIVEPLSSAVIDGWRTSERTVAAFRFGSIADSYADRTGRSRNIGVIGAAVFRERGSFDHLDVHRRHDADPFPARFAPPPPPRRWR